MLWLLSGLVVVLGLVVLVPLAVGLVGRLRRNRSAVTALRITVQDGSSQLRAGQESMREWRAVRHQAGSSDPSA
ncbi:MAG TPA: hypothetical protein VIQ30_20235 [Pseudonocardia sp.]|jgi:hypothetical protein